MVQLIQKRREESIRRIICGPAATKMASAWDATKPNVSLHLRLQTRDEEQTMNENEIWSLFLVGFFLWNCVSCGLVDENSMYQYPVTLDLRFKIYTYLLNTLHKAGATPIPFPLIHFLTLVLRPFLFLHLVISRLLPKRTLHTAKQWPL